MIELGILKNFDSGTYKAGVQLAGSLTTYFDDISVAKNIPSSALVLGNYVILAIPGGNPKDACVIATWPGGSPGGGGGSKIQDADGDTSWDVEESADKDEVVGRVKAVEFFRGHDDGIITMAKQSAVSVYLSANQSNIPNDTFTKVNLDVVEYDIQGEFAGGKFTAKKAGMYLITGLITYEDVVADKEYYCYLYKNGVGYRSIKLHSSLNQAIKVNISITGNLAVNDYLEMYARHKAGVDTVDVRGTAITFTAMQITKVA